MWFLSSKFVFCTVLCLFTSPSFVSSQCCDFDTYICGWETGVWKTSDSYVIDTSGYPNFYSSKPSGVGPYVLFTQNMMGTTTSDTHFYVPSPGTVISFDYFFDLPAGASYSTSDFLAVSISNIDGSFTTSLLSSDFNNPSDIWRHIDFSCDDSIAYCCGSADKLPCYISITLTASLDYTYPQGLFAVDNIGTSCVAAPTTTTTPPPPPPTYCCNFEYNTCAFALSAGWYWSYTTPSPYIPYSDGNYIWTSTSNAVAYTGNQIGVYPATTFSFDYFLSSPNVQLEVSFIPTSVPSGEVVLDYLYYSSTAWTAAAIQCTTCCGGYSSCNGQLQVRLLGTSGYVGAIDNAARDESCGSYTFPCCYFNDPSLCGFSSTTVDGLSWLSSAVSAPYPPIPSPGSNFAYFDVTSAPTPLTASLYSPSVTINNDVQFITNVFAYTYPYTTYNYLQFAFQNSNTGILHPLSPTIASNGAWQSYIITCSNCCDGYPTCTGQVIAEVIVNVAGGEVQFGIDNFGIYGAC